MSFNFISNHIETGKKKTMEDLVNDYLAKQNPTPVVKTASTKEEAVEVTLVKVAKKEKKEDKEEKKENFFEKMQKAKAAKKKGKGKKDEECEEKDEECEKEEDKKKEASVSPLMKVAKLNGKTKSKLASYWKTVYPAAFVDAMLENY
jgi:hypothetical protein